MESPAEKPVRGDKKVYRGLDYQNEQRPRNHGDFQSLSEQTQHDSRTGKSVPERIERLQFQRASLS